MMMHSTPPPSKRYVVFAIDERVFAYDKYARLLRDGRRGLPPADECEFQSMGPAMSTPTLAGALKRFIRFVILGNYSPCLVVAGIEPWPAETLADRWRQWRAVPGAKWKG